ncbi:MAG: protoporphyrinogen oxidase [Planctomycetaceae bacterium]
MNGTRSIAVVGGGLTGLAAAHHLGELIEAKQLPIEVTLFEASSRVGGVFGTLHIDGHIVETGADSFITNKPWAADLCKRLGLEDQLISTNSEYQRSFILYEGRPVQTPDGFELLVPRKLRALLSSPFLSPQGKLDVANEAFVPPRTDEADESLADFTRRRFGQEMLDRIVQPMVGGIYTANPEHLSMQATLPRYVNMEREHGSLLRAVWQERTSSEQDGSGGEMDPPSGISGARYGLFASLKDGMSRLLDALEQRVRSIARVELESPVLSVAPQSSGGYRVTTSGGEASTFDGLILALPAYRSGQLITEWDTSLAERLSQIPYASSAILVSAHNLSDIEHPLNAFGLVIPHQEKRKVLAVSFLSRKFKGRSPDETIQLRTFVGGAMQPELFERDDASLIAMVRKELRDILGVRGEPLFHHLARYERAMPQYHVGHLDLVADIERREAEHRGLALAGNAYRGVGVPDSVHSGEQAAARVFNELAIG